MKRHYSKIGALPVLGTLAILAGAASMVAEGFFLGGQRYASLGWFGVGMIAYAALMKYLLAWPVYYEIGDGLLRIRAGLIKWKIPLDDIDGAKPSSSAASSPALSMDRVRIDYRKGSTRTSILVSPRDKERFFQDLAEASSHLRFMGDQVLRVGP